MKENAEGTLPQNGTAKLRSASLPLRVQFTLYSKVISIELTVEKYFNIFRSVRICYKKGK